MLLSTFGIVRDCSLTSDYSERVVRRGRESGTNVTDVNLLFVRRVAGVE